MERHHFVLYDSALTLKMLKMALNPFRDETLHIHVDRWILKQWRIQGGGGRPFLADFCFFGRFLFILGAASRNLDSRPPLFTDPGSASAKELEKYSLGFRHSLG